MRQSDRCTRTYVRILMNPKQRRKLNDISTDNTIHRSKDDSSDMEIRPQKLTRDINSKTFLL